MNTLDFPDDIILSRVERRDKTALMKPLHPQATARNTLSIVHPCTAEDAEAWIEERISHSEEQPAETTVAIRALDKILVGATGGTALKWGSHTVQTSATVSGSRTGTGTSRLRQGDGS